MRITTHLGRRVTALLAASVLAAGIGVAVSTPAEAASLGTLTITPTTGNELTGLNANLSTTCPAGSTGIVGHMAGPGISSSTDVIQSNRPADGASFQIDGTFQSVFANNSIGAPSGAYTVRIACIGADSFTEVGDFSQQVNFTPRAGFPNGATYVTVPANGTSTTLDVPTPADPVVSGTSVTLHATVNGGANGTPTGSIQFKSGATNVGAPVALTAGAASLSTTALPSGTDSLTAVYVPGGANPLGASTSSAVSYAVAGPTSVTGAVKVGGTITCSAATGGTKTYAWTKNGVVTGITTASIAVPASWYNASVTCSLTSTKSATSVTRTSAAVKIALGSALRYTVRPKVLGKTKVGKVLTCSHGTWSPAATSYKYQWYRGATALVGKIAVKYKTVRKDKGKLITCKVTASTAGYASGVAKAPARKVT